MADTVENFALDRLKNRSVEELNCNLCGKHLGFTYVYDLEESYFYCDECVQASKK